MTDGTTRWVQSLPFHTRCPAAVAAIGDTVVLVNQGLYAVRPSGEVVWQQLNGPLFRQTPVISSQHIVVPLGGRALRFSHAGAPVDTVGPAGAGPVQITVGASGVLYLLALDTLFSYAADGTQRFATPLPHPWVACDAFERRGHLCAAGYRGGRARRSLADVSGWICAAGVPARLTLGLPHVDAAVEAR